MEATATVREPPAGENGVELNGGYFSLPAGMRQFSGNLGLAQVVFWKSKLKIADGPFEIGFDRQLDLSNGRPFHS